MSQWTHDPSSQGMTTREMNVVNRLHHLLRVPPRLLLKYPLERLTLPLRRSVIRPKRAPHQVKLTSPTEDRWS